MDEFRIKEVIQRLGPEERVLDVGCVRHDESQRNEGNLHARINNVVEKTVGIDIIESEIKKMQAEGWNCTVGNAENLGDIGFEDEFDVVVAGELIEHLSNPGQFLDGAHKITTPTGRLILTTPNPHCITFTKKALFEKKNNSEHTCWFDEQFIRQLSSRHGWELDTVVYRPPKLGLAKLAWLFSEPIGSPGLIAVFHKAT